MKNHPLGWLAAAIPLTLGSALPSVAAVSAPSTQPSFARFEIALGGSPKRIEAGDVDGDGDADLVVFASSPAAATLTVLRNNGDDSVVLFGGTPLLQAPFSTSWVAELTPGVANLTPDLELGDLDGDGDLDLLRCIPFSGSTGLSSHLNAGDGTFDAFVSMIQLTYRVENELGDLDADGVLDYAYHDVDLIGYTGSREGNGDGSFQSFGPEIIGGSSDLGTRAALGEVSGDTLLDLLMASNAGLEIARGKALSPLPGWHPVELLAAGSFGDVAIADVDGDLVNDVVASQTDQDKVAVLLGGSGGLASAVLFAAGPWPDALTVADVSHDSIPDVVTVNRKRGLVSVMQGAGDGELLPPVSFTVTQNPSDIASADLDGDGDVDLAVADYRHGTVTVLFNRVIP